MSWVIGACQAGGQRMFELLSSTGQVEQVAAEALATSGVPCGTGASTRVVYEGDLETWSRVAVDEYLQAFGIELPPGLSNRHSVFLAQLADGTSIFVPALALMRGIFRPHELLMPLAFTPGNVDLMGFVDYSNDPPTIVLDGTEQRNLNKRDAASRYEPVRWMLSSTSANRCAHSVYLYSLSGRLDLRLPQGQFRLVLHGRQVASSLFVTKVTVTWVTVPVEDSVTRAEHTHVFHRMAAKERTVPALAALPPVPVLPDGRVELTDLEWDRIKPLLDSKKRNRSIHSGRELLNLMLFKLSSGSSWKTVTRSSNFQETTLTTTFRYWQLDGRFSRVLSELMQLRGTTRNRPAQYHKYQFIKNCERRILSPSPPVMGR
ncbi:transposase [Malikia spinosa]|uniref:Transposase n=1 Tax=Malikia spinosa TaxID=86180 RepID=A0A2S9KAU1_9BURK|nr:transposase [Malikia spinosa]MYZ50872.1 transposase [Malikia spinosa]PRD67505.1 hypothetical protein C6P61_16100 [Malikia spinosa]